jgi:hypothetical protein
MNFRKKYLIYPKFQLILVFANLLVSFFFPCLVILFLGQLKNNLNLITDNNLMGMSPSYFEMVSYQLNSYVYTVIISFALCSLLGSIFFIWISHKIVGPITNLMNFLKKYEEAKLNGGPLPGALSFRKDDLFLELPELVNKALSAAESSTKN